MNSQEFYSDCPPVAEADIIFQLIFWEDNFEYFDNYITNQLIQALTDKSSCEYCQRNNRVCILHIVLQYTLIKMCPEPNENAPQWQYVKVLENYQFENGPLCLSWNSVGSIPN